MMDAETLAQLDAPVWAALTTAQRAFAEGGPLALRYPPEVTPFAAMRDRTAESFAALSALVPRGGRLVLHTPDRLEPPQGLVIDMQAPVLQMVLGTPMAPPPAEPVPDVLGPRDVGAMLDLAERTRPGPFGPRTIELGRYIGLRHAGMLAAMVGERMRFGRHVELSAVCVDPAVRGRGYAALLLQRIGTHLQAEGLVPFLHVFESNAAAIALYAKLGFAPRRTFFVTSLRHP